MALDRWWALASISCICTEADKSLVTVTPITTRRNATQINTSKTEFLLIGFIQQLAKINSCSLGTVHSARNLGFILDEHLTFSDQISALSIWKPQKISVLLTWVSSKTSTVIHVRVPDCQLNACGRLIGGASAVKEPGHFEVRKSSSQVTWMHFFLKKVDEIWRPFLVVALKTQAANAVSPSK